MAVNKLKLRVNQIKDGVYDRQILFPLGQSYDEVGREDLIGVYEDETIDKLVGIKRDYEVTRYTHAPLENGDPSPNLFYNFMFGSLVNSILNLPLQLLSHQHPLQREGGGRPTHRAQLAYKTFGHNIVTIPYIYPQTPSSQLRRMGTIFRHLHLRRHIRVIKISPKVSLN